MNKNEILKRLEIIKTSIELDDEEIVELQIKKLQQLPIDKDVQNILQKLKNREYSDVFEQIGEYLKRYSGVAKFVDGEIETLKLELKSLKEQLQKLSEQKQEALLEIEEFNTLYNLQLGELIGSILKRKKQLLQKELEEKKKLFEENQQKFTETKETVAEVEETLEELEKLLEEIDVNDENYKELLNTYDELYDELIRLQSELKEQEDVLQNAKEELEDNPLYKKYEEATADYETFQKNYKYVKEQQEESFELSAAEKKELKILWKKASRLCHPDIVDKEFKEQANTVMQQLNESYAKKDIEAIKKIYAGLKNGTLLEVEYNKIENKKVLKAKIKELKVTLKQLQKESEEIEQDETFQTIQQIDDWDEYFTELKTELEKELNQLEVSLNEEDTKEELTLKQEVKQTLFNHEVEEVDEANNPLYDISNISFEKIRRYYNNLLKNNTADIMAQEFSENAKLYKALVYDTLEQFMYDLTYNELSIIDWGCSQGMGSALVLDYIKEKQLNIKVTQVILIDDDKKALSRAKLHADVLKQNELDIITIDVNKNIEKLNEVKNGFALNLFVNEKDIVDLRKVNLEEFVDDYFICVSNKNGEFVNDIFNKFSIEVKQRILTDRKTKIGRFQKYEKIFQVTGIILEIDNDDIPF